MRCGGHLVRLLHQAGPYRPSGLAPPLAAAATLLRYAMGEGADIVAGPCPDLVGRVLPVFVFTSDEKARRRMLSRAWVSWRWL